MANDRIDANSGDRGHVERGTEVRTPTHDTSIVTMRAAIDAVRCESYQTRESFTVDSPQLRQFNHQCGGQCGADPRHSPEECGTLGEGGRVAYRGGDGTIEGGKFGPQEGKVTSDRLGHERQSEGEAVFFGDLHAEQLTTTNDEGDESTRGLIGDLAEGWTHTLAIARKDMGVELIGLRKLTGVPREVPHFPGIDQGNGQAGGGARIQ